MSTATGAALAQRLDRRRARARRWLLRAYLWLLAISVLGAAVAVLVDRLGGAGVPALLAAALLGLWGTAVLAALAATVLLGAAAAMATALRTLHAMTDRDDEGAKR